MKFENHKKIKYSSYFMATQITNFLNTLAGGRRQNNVVWILERRTLNVKTLKRRRNNVVLTSGAS